MKHQNDSENEFAEAFKMAVEENQKETIPEYASDKRALHNISLLSEAYRKLVGGIIRVEQSEEMRECYMDLERAFCKVIKCEAADIVAE